MYYLQADEFAAKLLEQYKDQTMFEVSLADKAEYLSVMAAFARLGCRTGPDGEFFRVKVYPKG